MISRSKLYKCILLAAVSLLPLVSLAQPVLTSEQVSAAYPDQYLVITKLKSSYEFLLKNNKPCVKTTRYFECVYLSEKAISANTHSIHYSPTFNEDVEYEAYVYTPNEKGKLKQEKVKNFATSSAVSSGVFYDDQKEVKAVYPNVKKGSFTTIYHEMILNEPRLLPPFYFQRGLVVMDAELEVIVPDNFKVKMKMFGDSTGIVSSKIVKKGKTSYYWKGTNLKGFEEEGGSPDYSYFSPHLICIPESYTGSDDKVTKMLGDTKDLYSWYQGFVEKINAATDPSIQTLVDSITAGKTDTLEKAKIIYSWVQSNMKYVAFEDGMGGFIPREANKIYERRYGDCKDMSSMLYVMLRAAGIKACYTWIGTRDIPYTYTELPSPLCDNHMICAFHCGNKWWFLDGTTTYLAFGYPSGFIQGKEALVGLGNGTFEVVKVPEVESSRNFIVDSMHLYVEKATIKGVCTSIYSGYPKENLVHSLARHKNLQDMNALSGLFEVGNNKFVLTAAEFNGMEDNNKDLHVKNSFEVPNYIKAVENDLYVNLNLDKYLGEEFLYPDKRKTAWEVEYKTLVKQNVVFHIPEGYELVKLPKNSTYSDEEFGFDISYSQDKNTVIMNRAINLNTLCVSREDFERWNTMINKLSAAYKDVMTLRKK